MLLADQRVWQLVEPFMWLVGVLLLAAAVIAVFKRWQRRPETTEGLVNDQMTEFRRLYEAGQMSKEEYERVHSLLAGRLQENVKPVSSPPTAQPAETPKNEEQKPPAP